MRHPFSSLPRALIALLSVRQAYALGEYLDVCNQIKASVSNASDVFFPGSITYSNDIEHWAGSSTQQAACSVEPGTAADVGTVLKIVGAGAVPFAVKGGGHASNPGFSSTTGIHISMARFSDVVYNASSKTATIGTGLVWDDVYAALEPYGVNIVGGRVTGVGVAGFTLGGGYSWKSNQYGLTVDTLVSYELVFTNGTVRTVTASDADLFWALKGGGNNFGVVTHFTLKTFPQTEVYGGIIIYTGDQIAALANATLTFQNTVTDLKAAIITTLNVAAGLPGAVLLLFYDAPTAPAGTFDMFMNIPAFSKDVKTRSFSSLVQAAPSDAVPPTRAIFDTITVPSYTPALMTAIVNETLVRGSTLALQTGTFISYEIEPFAQGFLQRNRTSDSAYPPTRSQGAPLNIYYGWTIPTVDTSFQDAARDSAARLESIVGTRTKLPRYPNYAIYDTPLTDMYGASGPARLKRIAQRVDPKGVMKLAGGFKLQ
ncbi:FAD-binding domain-containing protein [Exidia glandulosa HHB12029]|uniref:FAD-binding domain-containing protein n=1 Tax=Exidia glandulosa HHB12029 TaxID=1314781 RepID=A0A165LMS1_EXIGL|nr:FAD-binding domain-containing protein [Exidia glandulosa HHB12029]